MKNFAINLETCSKKDRKEAIRLAKDNGYTWLDSDRFKGCVSFKWKYIYFNGEDKKFNYCHGMSRASSLSLPRDWDTFKESIGIKEPKNGEVWVWEYKYGNPYLGRVESIKSNEVLCFYSAVHCDGKFIAPRIHEVDINTPDSFTKRRPATPEEVSKLEKAERENGYYWNGEELVKVEYVRRIGGDISSRHWHNELKGSIFKVVKVDQDSKNVYYVEYNGRNDYYLMDFKCCEPATKEEYEAQERKVGEYSKFAHSQFDFYNSTKSATHNTGDWCELVDYKAKYEELKSKLKELIEE